MQANAREVLPELSETVLAKLVQLFPFSDGVAQSVDNLMLELIRKMPKTDLHVHGEAGFSVDIELMREIAKRNGLEFPEELVEKVEGVSKKWKYRGNPIFREFIYDFLAVSALIRTPLDIEEMCYAYYRRCYENNVVFTLPGISWVQCKNHMTMQQFHDAYNRALERGMRDFGHVTVMRFRYYHERHLAFDEFNEVLEAFIQFPNPLVTTMGLAGDEKDHPLSDFEAVYKKARIDRKDPRKPWLFTTSHMERYTNPEIIRGATALLDWVGHGWYVVDDARVVDEMAESGITFEVCPISDTYCFADKIPTIEHHAPLKTLVEKGLATLNSDDPAFFGDINEVYKQVFLQLKVSLGQLLACTLRGLNPASRQTLLEMEKYRPQEYAAHMKIVQVGMLKGEFFKAYWNLLPLVVAANLDSDLARRILAVDLKMATTDLAALGFSIPQSLQREFSSLMTIKKQMDQLTAEIHKETEMLLNTRRVELTA